MQGTHTDVALQRLLELDQEHDFKISTDFETLEDSGPRSQRPIQDWLAYLVESYGSHPAYYRYEEEPRIVVGLRFGPN